MAGESETTPPAPPAPDAHPGDGRSAGGAHSAAHDQRLRNRVLRIRVTDVDTGRLKVGLTLPAGLVSVAMRLGARLLPHGHDSGELVSALARGDLRTPITVEDTENGEIVEISVES